MYDEEDDEIEMNEDTARILEAIEDGEFTVSYNAPNCFEQRTKPNGDVFYVIRGDDANFGCSMGSTTVSICEYDFTWIPEEGEWEGLDEDIDPTGEISEFLNGCEDIITLNDCPDIDDLAAFYEIATGECVDEVYYYEDDNIPEGE